jgi:hypothetical protein
MANSPVILLAFANDREGRFLRSIAEEHRLIKSALSPLEDRGLLKLVELPNATAKDIFEAFRKYKDRIEVFHYGGHAEDLSLLLSGSNTPLDVASFADYLSHQRGLKLVFMNGCATGAQQKPLEAAGIPFLILTSTSINDSAAKSFADEFYQNLASGRDVVRAYEEASNAVKAQFEGKTRKLHWKRKESHSAVEFPWQLFQKSEEIWALKVKKLPTWIFFGVFSLIILLGSWGWIAFGPEPEPFDYTLVIQDEAGNPLPTLRDGDKLLVSEREMQNRHIQTIEKGKLGILLDGEEKWGEVDSKGNVFLKGIDHHYARKKVLVILDAKFWELAEQSREVTLKDRSKTLILKRNDILCTLQGYIELSNEQALEGANIEVCDLPDATRLLAKGKTQEKGEFKIIIPPLECKQQYVLKISHPDLPYTHIDTFYPEPEKGGFIRIPQPQQK